MLITLFKKTPIGALHYFTLHDRQPILTAPYALTTAWSMGERRERERLYAFETLGAMDRKIREIFSRRIREGYRLLYSFSRDPASLLSISRLSDGAMPSDRTGQVMPVRKC
ncbi:MAG: hypothetical protein NT080_11320 [Spirochaetes bacterium]|nr:hypothetical protein [Spirochaetota bacterium]